MIRIRPGAVATAILALVLACPAAARAEWQIRPYLGIAFGGETTILDLEFAADNRHLVTGVSGTLLGEWLGVEGDLAVAPKFFQAVGPSLVLSSRVTTLTGNVVVALPRRISQYGLRPYVVAGGGLMHVYWESSPAPVLLYRRTLPALDVGAGVTGFLNDRVGVSWDVRYIRSLTGPDEGLSIGGPEELSFWRGLMGVVVRVGRVR
ncbi:MAG TPA: outer membrane beta-barrel protein [Vicinamibacterales bacterium]